MSWNLLTKNGTWELIQKPKKKKIVGYRWSFRIKKRILRIYIEKEDWLYIKVLTSC